MPSIATPPREDNNFLHQVSLYLLRLHPSYAVRIRERFTHPGTGKCFGPRDCMNLSIVVQRVNFICRTQGKECCMLTALAVSEFLVISRQAAEDLMSKLRRSGLLRYKKSFMSYCYYPTTDFDDLAKTEFYDLDEDVVREHGVMHAAVVQCSAYQDGRTQGEVARKLGLDRANVCRCLKAATAIETQSTLEENAVYSLPTPKKERTRKHWSDAIDTGIGNTLQTNQEARGSRAVKALAGSAKMCNVKALLTQQFPDHGIPLNPLVYGLFIPRWKELGEPISELVPWLRFAVENWSMLRRTHQVSRDVKGRQRSESWALHPNLKNMGFSAKHINRYYKEHKAAEKTAAGKSTYRMPGGRPMTSAEYGAWFRQFQLERNVKRAE